MAERAVNIAQAESSGHAAGYFQYANVFRQLAVLLAAQGDWRQAVPYLEEAVALSERLPYLEAIRASQGVLAEHELTAGDPEAALARLNPLLEGRDVDELGVLQLLPTVALARAALGDAAAAEHILDDAIERARAQSHRLALVDVLRAQGIVLAQQERVDGALRMFEEAITVARGIAYPYAEGRALYAQGRLHSSAREWQAARERLQEALAVFQRLGAQLDEERAAQALDACAPMPE